MDAMVEGNMLSFATVRPLSEAKRIRMGLPPLPSNLLRLVQSVAHLAHVAHEAHEVCAGCKKYESSIPNKVKNNVTA